MAGATSADSSPRGLLEAAAVAARAYVAQFPPGGIDPASLNYFASILGLSTSTSGAQTSEEDEALPPGLPVELN